MRTEVPPELVEAYRATLFRCGEGSDAFVLRIGAYSASLADLYAAADVSSAAFVTAFNPRSEMQSAEANAAALARLGAELAAAGYHLVDGAGEDPDGIWPVEPSFLVLGLELESAQEVGRRYGQNAVVWAGAEAVPELLLLR